MSDQLEDIVINGVRIHDTFAEAFPMVATRIIVTALNYRWAKHATDATVGFSNISISAGGIESLIGSPVTIHPSLLN